MNGSPKSPIDRPKEELHPLAGADVVSFPLPARSHLSDWVDLMEVVEALCPKWPVQEPKRYGTFKL